MRREKIFDVFEQRMAKGDSDFVIEYSTALLNSYPDSVALMNWNAASRTERISRDKDASALPALIGDLREYVAAAGNNCDVLKKYLTLAEFMQKQINR